MGGFILSASSPLSYSFTEVNQDWTLSSDFTGSLRIQGGTDPIRFPIINLQGHQLTLDPGGIELKPYTIAATIYSGTVTSSEPFLNIRSLGTTTPQASGSLYIDSAITDSRHTVGVRFSGGSGGLVFEGDKSNTFTGNVEVSGLHNRLYLNKWDGAVAVRSDIFIEKGGLVFHRSGQLLTTSSVTLRDNAALIYDSLSDYSITNTFKNLVIEEGGSINFYHGNMKSASSSKYYIYLDDLIINESGRLTVQNWQDERDFLLVRKTSTNLADALKRMEFEGYDPANIHLRDFNSDYWQVSALPEPATYGAIFAATGLSLVVWRQKRRTTKEADRSGS